MTLLITVSESGLSGERNAYRSVLSADGSSAIAGASRWLDAPAPSGAGPRTAAATMASIARAAAAKATASLRMSFSLMCGAAAVAAPPRAPDDERDSRNRPMRFTSRVSEFSRTHIARSGYAREGFAVLYDEQRPRPPSGLIDVLLHVVQTDRPRLVVDLGAGTGLSTRAWAERADKVVGVEANAAMVERARAATTAPNVEYVEAYAAETGLREGGADLVTCAQSFHWMEPQPVLAEAARLLRPGGAFAAYDYDVPFGLVVHPEIDEAWIAHFAGRG